MSVEVKAERLIANARDINSSVDQLKAILDDHADCFEGDLCELCEYFEDESGEDLLMELAGNQNLSEDLQARVIALALDWQGAIHGVASSLARNAKVSKATKDFLLDVDFLISLGDAPETIPSLFEIMKSNPRFEKEELAKFVASAREFDLILQ